MKLVAMLGKDYVTDLTFAPNAAVPRCLRQFFAVFAMYPHSINTQVQPIFTDIHAVYFQELSSEHIPFAF